METITSLQNPLVKRIRALRHKKHRRRQQCFWAEGIHAVLEAQALGWPIDCLVWAPDLLRSQTARENIAAATCPVAAVAPNIFAQLSTLDHPQGLGALVQIRRQTLEDLQPSPSSVIAVLEEPRDPGNVGTVIRTAEAAGATGVIVLGPSADPWDPQAVRASMGALFGIPIVCLEKTQTFLTWAQEKSLTLVGTSARAAHNFKTAEYPKPLALLLGNEQRGLSAALKTQAHTLVHIPMRGRSTSLNLAAAATLLLYQALATELE